MINLKKLSLTILLFVLSITLTFSQKLNQTVRGIITDIDSKLPLIGATITIVGVEPIIGTVTDVNGKFRFENIPIGRIAIKISYVGYETKTIPDIVVNSGKEVVLDIALIESVTTLDEIVVKPNRNKGETLNNMALLSTRSISSEETKRYAGGWDDPFIILTNFAGVTSTRSGNIIEIRGNSPKYIQWRLEGVEISAPNHQLDQNATIGGFSCLNNKLLSSSEFYTGAFSPEYGNALSGVYDLKLRAGNNEKFESMVGFGLLGTDFTVEGPIKKGYAGSYLLNYRFSNIGLIQKLGLIGDIGGVSTTFQDMNFKVVLPSEKLGTFSFFGMGGLDNLKIKDIQQDIWQTPGNDQMMPDLKRDFYKDNYLANIGMSHTFTINKSSYIKTILSYSAVGLNDDVYESTIIATVPSERKLNYSGRIKTSTYKGTVCYNNKINTKNIFQFGTVYFINNEDNKQSQLETDKTNRFILIDYNKNINTFQNFASWKHYFNENISIVAGVHNINVLLNHKRTIEPRVAINWKFDNNSSIHAGYGKHSAMEKIHNYFARIEQPDGSVVEPNKNLGLLKADHYVLGYDNSITENVRAKLEFYYQYLYNLPVENNDTSYYATINEGADYRYVPLVNKGIGKNYGVEVTLERFFNKYYYFLINGTLFDSKYKALEGVWRNTSFNGNYLVNVLFGREFDKLGKNQNRTLSFNVKFFLSGGQRYIPLLRGENGSLAVDPTNQRFFDYNKAYNRRFDNIYQFNISISYKFNKFNTTHEIYLDLPNITNHQSRLSEYYDTNKSNKIGYVNQTSFIPNFMYRVYFK